MSDLALGVRLSVGGNRTSWARLVLSTMGIAVAVAVLLVAASVGTMSEQRSIRGFADVGHPGPVAGVEPTYVQTNYTEFRGERVRINYLHGTAADSPKPTGLPALPEPGEMYVSPALGDLLRSPDGELLRPRLPDEIAGSVGKELVPMPGDLVAFVGADESIVDDVGALPAYAFGGEPPDKRLAPGLMVLLLLGAVVLLLPVFIFVSSASRIAGAERDRRLSALRLVGSGARQVRRIAAAETLVSAFTGLVVGGLVFAVGRLFTEDVQFFGLRAYVSDVVPEPWLVVLIVLAIPALTVLTALFALRRTIIEPLGVVRQGRPVRRRLWWRAALIVVGLVLMVTQAGAEEGTDAWAFAISAGGALLLVGVPVLLPWLVERVAGHLHGGPSSWLLAVRRLQLDSGTSARVVGGVAVVLAGAIALQTVLMSMEGQLGLPRGAKPDPTVEVSTTGTIADEVERNVREASGVHAAYTVLHVTGFVPGTDGTAYGISVADCAAIRMQVVGIDECADGDVFLQRDEYQPTPEPGTAVEFREYGRPEPGARSRPEDYEVTGGWTLPDDVTTVDRSPDSDLYSTIVATPGAVTGAPVPRDGAVVVVEVGADLTSDQLEGIRNAVAGFGWRATVYSFETGPDLTGDQQMFVAVRTTLYAGSIFTLMLAGVSLLVLALEHIRERRRQLAVLAASGVPRGVLGRSLLWQIALPIGLGTVVALVTGVGLAAMFVRLAKEPLHVDWPGVLLLCAGAMVLSVLVAAMTLPFLRSATRLTSLRTE